MERKGTNIVTDENRPFNDFKLANDIMKVISEYNDIDVDLLVNKLKKKYSEHTESKLRYLVENELSRLEKEVLIKNIRGWNFNVDSFLFEYYFSDVVAPKYEILMYGKEVAEWGFFIKERLNNDNEVDKALDKYYKRIESSLMEIPDTSETLIKFLKYLPAYKFYPDNLYNRFELAFKIDFAEGSTINEYFEMLIKNYVSAMKPVEWELFTYFIQRLFITKNYEEVCEQKEERDKVYRCSYLSASNLDFVLAVYGEIVAVAVCAFKEKRVLSISEENQIIEILKKLEKYIDNKLEEVISEGRKGDRFTEEAGIIDKKKVVSKALCILIYELYRFFKVERMFGVEMTLKYKRESLI